MELTLNKKILQIKGATKGKRDWAKFEIDPNRTINGDEEFIIRLKVEVFEIGQRNLQDGTFDKVHYAKVKDAELIM